MADPNPTLPQLTQQEIHNFWSKVDKTPGQGPKGECWGWKAGRTGDGYGAFCIRRRVYAAHRVSYYLQHGKLPDGMLICHKCDYRPCVRPDHLFPGTNRDNIQDAIDKGRFPQLARIIRPEARKRGDEHWARITPEKVKRGDNHRLRLHPETALRGEQHGQARLTAEKVREIRRRYATGTATKKELSREFGITDTAIHWIIIRKTWKHVE